MKNYAFNSDADLLKAMRGSESERREALNFFFENPRLLRWVVNYVRQQGGSEHDGKDVFEESFLVFERCVRTGHFRGESSLVTYFHGIARWQWLRARRKSKPSENVENMLHLPSEASSPEKILISEERRVMLSDLMTQVGERCKMLLGLFQLEYSMREISDIAGYANEQTAANAVHSCREKLKALIQGNKERMDTLKNRT